MRSAKSWLSLFGRDDRGQISIIFAFTSIVLVLAVGAGIDLSRSYFAIQQLSHAATMTCQFATRDEILADATTSQTTATTYRANVNAYATKTLTEQRFAYTQLTSPAFTYTYTTSAATKDPADVTFTANMATTFTQVAGITSIPLKVQAHCYDDPSEVVEEVTDTPGVSLIDESFEANANNAPYIFFPPSGSAGTTVSSPQQTFPSASNYTGANANKWYIMGYCLETDKSGQIRSVVPDGSRSAELDCDNGSGSKGNSSISTKVYLDTGTYELRYNYTLRTTYTEYTYSVLCGSTAPDISWATSTAIGGGGGSGQKTNQINVYLDQNTSSGAPPLHTTTFDSQTLAGANLIDNCVYADDWVERSVSIKISSPGYYWLSFAADGNNDSYGGQVDDVRLCISSCTDTYDDNFMSQWVTNPTLFYDDLESPTYSATTIPISAALNTTYGTSSTSTSGWPNEAQKGWAVGATNSADIIKSSTLNSPSTYSVELDTGTIAAGTNKFMSRTFLLVPGYYKLEYRYISNAAFASSVFSTSTIYCGATPTAAPMGSISGTASWTSRLNSSTSSGRQKNTNYLGVFMSHTELISVPIVSSTLGATTQYENPNGTTTTTPTDDPKAVSLTAYDTTQDNPLIDICAYSKSWTNRTGYFKITKPNYYQLTIAALGQADGLGGDVDNIKLTAMGSPFMSSPPSGAVTIPVPGTQPDSIVTMSGYTIVANPFMPPASQ